MVLPDISMFKDTEISLNVEIKIHRNVFKSRKLKIEMFLNIEI